MKKIKWPEWMWIVTPVGLLAFAYTVASLICSVDVPLVIKAAQVAAVVVLGYSVGRIHELTRS